MGAILLFWQELESRGGFTILQQCLMSFVLNMKMNSSSECVLLCFELSKTPDINSYQIISEIESYATKLGYPILQ